MILCCWELITAGDNSFKPVFLVSNHLNLDFLKFEFFFFHSPPFGTSILTFLM